MRTTKSFIFVILGSLSLLAFGWWGSDNYKKFLDKDLSLPSWNKPKPLEKYSIENLSTTEIKAVNIKVEKNSLFSFEYDPTLQNKEGKKVTGYINIPKVNTPDQKFPLILLIRGYVDPSIYSSGVGTKRVGDFFAENGYITIAPDFLGYAGSDIESSNIFEARFQTYTTVLTLLKSINSQNFPLWDNKNIFIWAHSNGGQIALTTLEITGANYPTVLWAPVTKPFPYSILYFTDESEDHGKFIRLKLSKFEEDYDVEKYSLTNYLERINAPIELHQGTNDDAVPTSWSDTFYKEMTNLDKDIKYYKHPGADHNMNPHWGDVIIKTLDFFTAKR